MDKQLLKIIQDACKQSYIVDEPDVSEKIGAFMDELSARLFFAIRIHASHNDTLMVILSVTH
ncbi:MAG: hypothetical protein D6B27_06055 [Gammaproteobacteria bacterium]|nr:MAG: hypothetical protein D6B27_06055 [Gammaproteobacteria bacterium]